MINHFSLWVSEKHLYFAFIFVRHFTQARIPQQFCSFLFSTLRCYWTLFSLALFLRKILPHFQVCSSYICVTFLYLLLGFLFVTGFEQFDYYVYWCHFPYDSYACISLSLSWIYTNCGFMLFNKFSNISVVTSSNIFSVQLPPSLWTACNICSVHLFSCSVFYFGYFLLLCLHPVYFLFHSVSLSFLMDWFFFSSLWFVFFYFWEKLFFYWTSNTLNFNSLGGRYFCIPIKYSWVLFWVAVTWKCFDSVRFCFSDLVGVAGAGLSLVLIIPHSWARSLTCSLASAPRIMPFPHQSAGSRHYSGPCLKAKRLWSFQVTLLSALVVAPHASIGRNSAEVSRQWPDHLQSLPSASLFVLWCLVLPVLAPWSPWTLNANCSTRGII